MTIFCRRDEEMPPIGEADQNDAEVESFTLGAEGLLCLSRLYKFYGVGFLSKLLVCPSLGSQTLHISHLCQFSSRHCLMSWWNSLWYPLLRTDLVYMLDTNSSTVWNSGCQTSAENFIANELHNAYWKLASVRRRRCSVYVEFEIINTFVQQLCHAYYLSWRDDYVKKWKSFGLSSYLVLTTVHGSFVCNLIFTFTASWVIIQPSGEWP